MCLYRRLNARVYNVLNSVILLTSMCRQTACIYICMSKEAESVNIEICKLIVYLFSCVNKRTMYISIYVNNLTLYIFTCVQHLTMLLYSLNVCILVCCCYVNIVYTWLLNTKYVAACRGNLAV